MARAARLAAIVTLALAASSCTFGGTQENPYRGLEPAPASGDILENVNLASLGLRAYDCDLFEAPESRCYDAAQWLSVRDGREALAHIHRELLDAGARYWGSTDSSVIQEAPLAGGLEIGCYFDYEAGDHALRVAVVGPSGEREACVNGLPGDGVTEVWIIAADFSLEEVYGHVEMPAAFELLLQTVPRRVPRVDDIYGGDEATVEGYFGPELPRLGEGYGLDILEETVSVRAGVVRGLVQYRGAAPLRAPEPTPSEGNATVAPPEPIARVTTGAVGVVIEAGSARYEVPMIIRPGESAPFEIVLPDGVDETDLRIVPGWDHTNEPWWPGLRLDGPVADAQCGATAGLNGAAVPELAPTSSRPCLVFSGQATTTSGTWIQVQAVTATFAADGTVVEVTSPYLVRSNGGEPGLGELRTDSPDLNLAWLSVSGGADLTGVWLRYVKVDDMTDSTPADQGD